MPLGEVYELAAALSRPSNDQAHVRARQARPAIRLRLRRNVAMNRAEQGRLAKEGDVRPPTHDIRALAASKDRDRREVGIHWHARKE